MPYTTHWERNGIEKAKLENAKRMLEKGLDIQLIIEINGLSREEIEKLKE